MMNAKNYTKEQIAAVYKPGMTDRKAGEILGCSKATAQKYRAMYGVESRGTVKGDTAPVTISVARKLRGRVKQFQQERGMNKSEAMCHLMMLGLKVEERRKARQEVAG